LKEVRKTLEHGLTEDQALMTLLQLKVELREGDSHQLAKQTKQTKKITVAGYAEQWLEAKAQRVRPAVAIQYEYSLSQFILPQLGELFMDTVTRADVERWVAWAEKKTKRNGQPYARDSVHGWWRVLSAMLRDAAAELGLLRDPTCRVRPPRVFTADRGERRTLSADELARLLNAVKELTPHRYAEVYLLAYTGMRAGELFGLHWDDIDEPAGLIQIRRSAWRGHLNRTKTGSPRDVALTAEMAEMLREHRRALLAAQHPGLNEGMVFPGDNGEYRVPSSLHKPLQKAAAAEALPIRVTPQVLRRTFNTLMLQAGIDRIVLRSQMGHCSEEMTERYTGVDISSKQAALAELARLVGKE